MLHKLYGGYALQLHSLRQSANVCPQPSYVRAAIAAACVLGRCFARQRALACPRTGPSLCTLSTLFIQAAPVGSTRWNPTSFGFHLARRFLLARNGILQSSVGQRTAQGCFTCHAPKLFFFRGHVYAGIYSLLIYVDDGLNLHIANDALCRCDLNFYMLLQVRSNQRS